jgi:hypothetical protein
MPHIRAMSSFRDAVRQVAMAKGDKALTDILALCDKLRDVDLVPLGVALDDQDGAWRLSAPLDHVLTAVFAQTAAHL